MTTSIVNVLTRIADALEAMVRQNDEAIVAQRGRDTRPSMCRKPVTIYGDSGNGNILCCLSPGHPGSCA